MNSIETQLQTIKAEGRLGLMTHVVAGYPNLEATRELVVMMAKEGVDLVEIQIPFSDPLGDGSVIREANATALENGVHVKDVFALVKTLRAEDKITIPFFFMTYLNIPFTYGLEKFCGDAAAVGINGLIIPDYNPDLEARENLESMAKANNLILLRFASLDSSAERLTRLAKGAAGFVYCFSTRGITGTREELDPALAGHLQNLRPYFAVPLGVGFGIASGTQARQLQGYADVVIVGSVLLKAYQSGSLEGARAKVRELVAALGPSA